MSHGNCALSILDEIVMGDKGSNDVVGSHGGIVISLLNVKDHISMMRCKSPKQLAHKESTGNGESIVQLVTIKTFKLVDEAVRQSRKA